MRIFFFCLVTLASISGFAESKCVQAAELKGRDELAQKFIHSQPDAPQAFAQFCKDNAAKVSCKTKTMAILEVKKATSEMMKGHPCAQLSSVKNTSNTSTLYFFDASRK